MKQNFLLGTRGSPLALLQAGEVKKKLLALHKNSDLTIEIVPIKTTGDWKPSQGESRFIELGGNKELFTKEIEDSLHEKYIDLAVHSMKDLAGHLPDGLKIAALLKRLDPRDAFIGREVRNLADLPLGASVGTSSLRRQAQVLARRPDLRIVPLRGNVDTRLRKLNEGMADATILAVAGLERLGAKENISSIMETDLMLPAAAQGTIGIEIRRDDEIMQKLLEPLNDWETSVCVGAERALLRALGGSCQTPVGALARLIGKDELLLEGLVAKPDGTALIRLEQKGTVKDYESIGMELGARLKGHMPPGFFAA
jgi:hydroxymethylbilane synthase